MSSFCDEISLIDCVAIEITNIAIGAISVYVIHNFNHEKKYGFKNGSDIKGTKIGEKHNNNVAIKLENIIIATKHIPKK